MKVLKTVLTIAVVEICVRTVAATTVIDQDYFPPVGTAHTYANVGVNGTVIWAQTFTAAISGELNGLDLSFFKQHATTQPITYDIRRTINGVPLGDNQGNGILASGSVDPNSIPLGNGSNPPELHIDLTSASPVVVSGDILAIVLRSLEPADATGLSYAWRGANPGGYGNGQSYFLNAVFGWQSFPYDLTFRTYVSSIPEPSTILLLLIGSIAAIPSRSRSHRPAHTI